jgi:uncharacterized protein YpmS
VSEQEPTRDVPTGPEHEHLDKWNWSGVAIIVIAVVLIAQVAWQQYQREQEQNCQAAYNLEVAQDRNALNQMIFTIMDPESDRADKVTAVQDYIVRARKMDQRSPADCD